MALTRKEFLDLAARTGMGAVALPAALGRPRGEAAQSAVPATAGRRDDYRGTTADVIRFIETSSIANFPADVVQQGKRCLIDGFGVILAGATVRGSAIVRNYVKNIGGKPEATLFGPEPVKGPVELAALANGASGHAMDFDDTQLSTTPDRTFGLLTHPTVPALSSALALSERQGASGLQFLEAFLVGFEVECKIAEAINPDHYNRGFHSTGTIGTFAGAAAAAKLLKQNSATIAHALAIASSLSAGIRVNFGSMTKPFHSGRAAQDGVLAAARGRRFHRRRGGPRWTMGVFPGVRRRRRSDSHRGRPRSAVHHRESGRVVQAVSVRIAQPSEHGRDAQARRRS